MSIWLHFVGGYYSPSALIKEAQGNGVSRRIAPNMAAQMEFGDTVYLANWKLSKSTTFAKFVIERVFLEASVAVALGLELIASGQAEYIPGGPTQVVRKCGTYAMVGNWVVTASLEDIVRRAIELAEGTKPWFMVGGPLVETYDIPLPVSTPFFRGFKRLTETAVGVGGGILSAVAGYKKRTRKRRRDIQMELEMST